MIKKYWVYYLFGFSVIFFVYEKFMLKEDQPEKRIEVKSFKHENGWGYHIYINGKIYISQEIIPAIEGNKSFSSEKDALIIGKFVAEKMQRKNGLPTITPREIDSLGIIK